jgi:hypothetical protein
MPAGPSPSPVAALVLALARVPRVLLALVVGLCLLAGLLLPGPWSALLLLPVLVVMGALTAAAWPLLLPAQRGLRVLVLVVLALAVVSRALR